MYRNEWANISDNKQKDLQKYTEYCMNSGIIDVPITNAHANSNTQFSLASLDENMKFQIKRRPRLCQLCTQIGMRNYLIKRIGKTKLKQFAS
jgi:hypothetical protein